MRTYRVKELAKARGLSQTDLFALCEGEVSLTFIQRLWQNRAPEGIRHKNLEAVAKALGVSIEDLYVDSPDSGSQPKPAGNRTTLVGAAA